MKIIPFQSQYTENLKTLGQLLRNHIVSCETRDDDLIAYNTDHEMDEYIADFHAGKIIILLAQEDDIIIGYGIGKLEEENWEGSQIKKFGKLEQLYVDTHFRGKGVASSILQSFEKIAGEDGASHVEISVFALNTSAHNFYKKYGFEERLITLGKKVGS